MKVRDSGMPEERLWSSFFNVENILSVLHVDHSILNLMEVGCGYGTFTIEAAKRISGKLYTFDIESEMVAIAHDKATEGNIANIEFFVRDIIAEKSGLPLKSMDYVMLFNILHHENPLDLLAEAYFVLKKGGKAGIIHWRSDIETPRGPALSIRPGPEQCIEWALLSGFEIYLNPVILEPFHFGLIIRKP
jgi:ubiquinone/menaquinone biosynthesis C-methylase UbiE